MALKRQGKTKNEIAAALGIKPHTANSLIAKAQEKEKYR